MPDCKVCRWFSECELCDANGEMYVEGACTITQLKPLNSVIQVCAICGKPDVYKDDKHTCDPVFQEYRRMSND